MTDIYFDYSRQGQNQIGGWGLSIPALGITAHGPLMGLETSEAGAMLSAIRWLRANGLSSGHLINDDINLPRVIEKRRLQLPEGFTLSICSRDEPEHQVAHHEARLGRTELLQDITNRPLDVVITSGHRNDCIRLSIGGVRSLTAHCRKGQLEGTARFLLYRLYQNMPCPAWAKEQLLELAQHWEASRSAQTTRTLHPTPAPDREPSHFALPISSPHGGQICTL